MDSAYKNKQIEKWLTEHKAAVDDEFYMVERVDYMENVWKIDGGQEDKSIKSEDMDAQSPLYSGQSEKVKQLKKKKIWIVINPVYRIYANVKVRWILFARGVKESGLIWAWNRFLGKIKRFGTRVLNKLRALKNKIANRWRNRKSVIRKRNRIVMERITYSPEKIAKQRETKFARNVKCSVVVPLYNTPERYLRDMIESVLDQTYANLELCLGDASDAEHVAAIERVCREYEHKDSRVRYKKLAKNDGIAENTNRCIEMATGDYIALLDHDDMYHPGALFACVECIEKENAEFIYTDEMTFKGDRLENVETLHFKPDFSAQNLKGVNYICHLCVFKKSLLEQTGMFDDAYNGSQDHDMILKLTSVAKVVSHIPEILYFWRVHPQSVSMNISAKSYAIDAGRAAVRDNEKRAGRKAEVFSSCICATHYRLEYPMVEEESVSIIILNHNGGTKLARLIDSVKKRTEYTNYDIILADLQSTDHETEEYLSLIEEEEKVRVIRTGTDCATKAANMAVKEAAGSCLVFLKADMEVVKRGWLKRLVPYAMQRDIGMIGSKISNDKGQLLSAGYIAGLGEDGIAVPIGKGLPYDTLGYMGRGYYVHNVSLLSLWGSAIRKNEYEAVGGLDEKLTIEYAVFDLCLRELARKKQVVLDSYVIMLEHVASEKAKSAKDDMAYMKEKWRAFFEKGDPYYNKNLSRTGSFNYDYE